MNRVITKQIESNLDSAFDNFFECEDNTFSYRKSWYDTFTHPMMTNAVKYTTENLHFIEEYLTNKFGGEWNVKNDWEETIEVTGNNLTHIYSRKYENGRIIDHRIKDLIDVKQARIIEVEKDRYQTLTHMKGELEKFSEQLLKLVASFENAIEEK